MGGIEQYKNPLENQQVDRRPGKKKDKGPENPERRRFLKYLAGGAAALAGSGVVIKGIEWMGAREESDDKEAKGRNGQLKEEPTPEQIEIKREEIKSIDQVLDYETEGRIEFDLETVEELKNNWKKKYREDPDYRDSLKKAYFEMGSWKEDLLKAFVDEGIDKEMAKKLIYLAVPESHWDPRAVSPALAAGPYQFLKSTARNFGLSSGRYADEVKNYDGRMDPVDSARACARHLLDVYRRADNDWDIALAGYNGNFANQYLGRVNYRNSRKEDGGPNEEKSYRGFASYVEEKINQVRDAIKEDRIKHEVQKGETLSRIAGFYCTNVKDMARANNMKSDLIKIGQKLSIPIPEENKAKAFKNIMSGYSENMVYPAKFKAVIELIGEGFVTEERKDWDYEEISVESSGFEVYTVKKGDNLFRISQQNKTDVDKIKKLNGLKSDNIRAGQELKIPGKKRPSLKEFAEAQEVSYKELMELNPGIIDFKKPIPEGYKVRVKR